MIFRRKTNVKSGDIKANDEVDSLILETRGMLEQLQGGNSKTRGEIKDVRSEEVISNINKILDIMQDSIETVNKQHDVTVNTLNDNLQEIQAENQRLRDRLKFANKVAKIGLWEINIINGEVMNENNTVNWTSEFRNLLGFSDEDDFPNVQSSWSNRIHPDAVKLVTELYTKHVNDPSGSTPYSIPYKLRLKNGEYRWFHSEAHTIRDKSGVPIKVVGSIRDISSERIKEELENELANKITDFSQSMKELVASIESITTTAQDLAKYQADTMKASQKMRSSTDETRKITEFIKNLSNQTNLLGLNASIEAARSGKEGLGFNVVAAEIRKLSTSSSNAVGQIDNSIKDMSELIEKITINVENINNITQTQASSTEEISACVEELNIKAEDLLHLATKIVL